MVLNWRVQSTHSLLPAIVVEAASVAEKGAEERATATHADRTAASCARAGEAA